MLAFLGCQGGFIEPGLIDQPGYKSGGSDGVGPGVSSSAPKNLTATSSSGNIFLSWNPVSGALFHTVYYSTSNNSSTSNQLSFTPSTNETVTVGVPGTRYYFWVTALNSSLKESGYSNVASVVKQ